MHKKIIVFLLGLSLLISFTAHASQFFVGPQKVLRSEAQKPELIKVDMYEQVYYKAADGNRYVFPNEKTFYTWYSDFSEVRTIKMTELEKIGIGGNVCYKPNSRLVKITTDPKVYWVGKFCELRHVASESLAEQLFGEHWADKVDDVPDPFFLNYSVGVPLGVTDVIAPEDTWDISENLDLYLD